MEFRISSLPVLYILSGPEYGFPYLLIMYINSVVMFKKREYKSVYFFVNSKKGVDVDIAVSKVVNGQWFSLEIS